MNGMKRSTLQLCRQGSCGLAVPRVGGRVTRRGGGPEEPTARRRRFAGEGAAFDPPAGGSIAQAALSGVEGRSRRAVALLLCLGLLAGSALAGDSVVAGAVVEEAPTVVCLGMRWLISGDDNGNAQVRVWYRQEGDTDWKEGLPLFRVDPEGIAYERKVPHMFAGSLFDLEPGTAYEVKLMLSDPDGGGATSLLRMSTRPVPHAPPDAQVRPVEAARLQQAVNEASPGQVLLVSPGTFQGTLDLGGRKGTAERPIVIRAQRPGTVIVDAQGARDVVDARESEHVYLEGLMLRGAQYNGVVADGAVGLVVRRCTIEGVKQGIRNTDRNRPGKDFYIADNVILGPYRWPTVGIKSEEGIQVCGSGHVVCFNRVRGWSDGISILDQLGHDYPATAIDFYNNDISESTDDAIEMDNGEHNVRAFRNRITDCHQGITNQPIYGGPCYIFRNVFYNLPGTPFKLHNRTSGIVALHNTQVRSGRAPGAFLHNSSAPVRNVYFRNNLFLGKGDRAIQSWSNFTGADLDYDGYSDGLCAFTKDGTEYPAQNLAEFARKSGLETHGTVVDLSVFARPIAFPVDDERHQPPDLRPAAGSAAVDAGLPLANVNDGFTGSAPDLGAYELGSELPIYGPRPTEE